MTALLDAPCVFCGYNGQRYYSEWTHAKSCPWYSVGGAAERTEQLRMVIQEQARQLEARYAFRSIEEWEESLGYKVSEMARIVWDAARLLALEEER